MAQFKYAFAVVGFVLFAACGGSGPDTSTDAPASENAEMETVGIAEPDPVLNFDEAIARPAIEMWARTWHAQTLIEPVEIFPVEATGDDQGDALAIIYFENGLPGRNADVVLFRKQDGAYIYERDFGPIQGELPRDVRFVDGRARLVTTSDETGEDLIWDLPDQTRP